MLFWKSVMTLYFSIMPFPASASENRTFVDPRREDQIKNTRLGRGVYFLDPSGHYLEIINDRNAVFDTSANDIHFLLLLHIPMSDTRVKTFAIQVLVQGVGDGD